MPPTPLSPGQTPEGAALADRVLAVSRRLRRGWLAALEPWGITPHHARALRIIVRENGVRIGALADILHVAPRSATDVVDALEADGRVRREPDPGDRRATIVVATEAGHELAAVAERARADHASEVFGALSDPDRAELGRLLDLLLES
ncbi:MarR family winged helix-turn-helix transcriptional regulator [Mobilicoccus massiliensis]|uniref:MarR family winged helix-turn-helix transcriptional regulator n=1 Tax=Mobilicoccus massiliensis TaxID=1522310 RepID=UPI00058D42AC|nr:MarR family transcriptional regulator [Mobilicoccus massiliensis]